MALIISFKGTEASVGALGKLSPTGKAVHRAATVGRCICLVRNISWDSQSTLSFRKESFLVPTRAREGHQLGQSGVGLVQTNGKASQAPQNPVALCSQALAWTCCPGRLH